MLQSSDRYSTQPTCDSFSRSRHRIPRNQTASKMVSLAAKRNAADIGGKSFRRKLPNPHVERPASNPPPTVQRYACFRDRHQQAVDCEYDPGPPDSALGKEP